VCACVCVRVCVCACACVRVCIGFREVVCMGAQSMHLGHTHAQVMKAKCASM